MDDYAELNSMSEDMERNVPMDKNGKNGTRESRGGAAVANGNGNGNGQAKNLPVHTVRLGGVKVAIWRNSTQNGPMYNATIVRTYKNQAGEWAESHSLSRDDMLLAAKALDMAHTFVVETETASRAQQQQSEPE